MSKHGLGTPESVVIDETGWVNPCFFVNSQFVIRFNARDPFLPKFHREMLVFDLLSSLKIPVPEKVILDDSHDVAPFDVLISSMLRGSNVEADWPTLPVDARSEIAKNAGHLLSQIHRVSFPFFGELSGRGPLPQTDTWEEFLKAKLTQHLGEARHLNLFDDGFYNRADQVFQDYLPFASEVNDPKLVHVDYHFGNLLHLGNLITGVLDFEWSFAGDPLYDFCEWRQTEELWPGSREPFFEGYGKRAFSFSENKRMGMYQLIRNVEPCIVAELHFGEEESREYRSICETQLNRLSTGRDRGVSVI